MANIIKQLKDSNGNNIYPIAYAQGGVKMDLLWTNPSPTSDFGAQTLSLNSSEYPLLLVEFSTMPATNYYYKHTAILLKDVEQVVYFPSNYNFFRKMTPTDSGITFVAGDSIKSWGSFSGTTNNKSCVPIRIFGIKMSYIVPTTVNGLQYVEV